MKNLTDMKILYLNLKRKWFDMILSGEKKEEYREIKEHWVLRLIGIHVPFKILESNASYNDIIGAYWYCVGYKGARIEAVNMLLENGASFKSFDAICFRNGYSKNAREILIECKCIDIGLAVPEWSDNWQGEVFRIHLGEILNKKL